MSNPSNPISPPVPSSKLYPPSSLFGLFVSLINPLGPTKTTYVRLAAASDASSWPPIPFHFHLFSVPSQLSPGWFNFFLQTAKISAARKHRRRGRRWKEEEEMEATGTKRKNESVGAHKAMAGNF
jgi:hypothetical protein